MKKVAARSPMLWLIVCPLPVLPALPSLPSTGLTPPRWPAEKKNETVFFRFCNIVFNITTQDFPWILFVFFGGGGKEVGGYLDLNIKFSMRGKSSFKSKVSLTYMKHQHKFAYYLIRPAFVVECFSLYRNLLNSNYY